MFLMLYVMDGSTGWKVSFCQDELKRWAETALDLVNGADDYHIIRLPQNELRSNLSVYHVNGNKANESLFRGTGEKGEYTAGSDGKYYVCVPSGKSYTVMKIEEIESLSEDLKNNYDIGTILEHADVEFRIRDAVNELSLDLCRNILCYALSNDVALSIELQKEGRIPSAFGTCMWLCGWDEEHIMSLISYLRFTRSLCTGVQLLCDELEGRSM